MTLDVHSHITATWWLYYGISFTAWYVLIIVFVSYMTKHYDSYILHEYWFQNISRRSLLDYQIAYVQFKLSYPIGGGGAGGNGGIELKKLTKKGVKKK